MNAVDPFWTRVARRVLLTVGRGRIGPVDDTGNVQLLQVALSPLETQDALPRLAEFGFTSSPPDKADAVVVFMTGDRRNGVVVATGHQQSRMKNLERGESALYDLDGRYVYLSKNGIVVEAKNGNVTVNNADVVTVNCTTLQVNGNLSVDGKIDATEEITSTLSGTHTLTQHHHGGVQTGSGNTSVPSG